MHWSYQTLTHLLPNQTVTVQQELIHGLQLADPTFHKPGKINLLLFADIQAQIQMNDMRRGSSESSIAQKTSFGWIR